MPTSFKVITLGCKLNFAESSTIARKLTALGLRQVGVKDTASVCIVNSCAVTQVAEKKCRQALQKAASESVFVVLTGCYAALQADSPHPAGVCIVPNKKDVPQKVAELFGIPCVDNVLQYGSGNFYAAYSLSGRTRSFLKVQDGCDYHCAYCTVPLARGASRSPSIADVVEQAAAIVQSGAKEIILTGINIGTFGINTGESLLQLIRALDGIPAAERYRISSIEPNLLTTDIIDYMARSPKFMPHFHIPLQAGSNRILQLMGRRYTAEFFAEKIESVLQRMPYAFIGIDIIAGFPTETDEEFADSAAFLESLGAAYLHVFPYSVRPNTPAAAMPQTPQHKITERTRILNNLCRRLHTVFYQKHLGSTQSVLFEGACKNGTMTGFTENYIRVEIPYDTVLVNRIVTVELCAILPNGNIEGKIVVG
jgi:threonylcarbamoyladenosine tRNA methylthiotransferase MtaB